MSPTRRRKGRGNAGSFRPGFDPRRHVFTPLDCRVGWLVANIRHPELREWLKMRLRCHYHQKGTPYGPPKVRGPVA